MCLLNGLCCLGAASGIPDGIYKLQLIHSEWKIRGYDISVLQHMLYILRPSIHVHAVAIHS